MTTTPKAAAKKIDSALRRDMRSNPAFEATCAKGGAVASPPRYAL